MWAWSSELCPGGLDSGAEYLNRLLVGDCSTIHAREESRPDDVLLQGVVGAEVSKAVRTHAGVGPGDAHPDGVGLVAGQREERHPAEWRSLEPDVFSSGGRYFDAPQHPPAADDGGQGAVVGVLHPMRRRRSGMRMAGDGRQVLHGEGVLEGRWPEATFDAPERLLDEQLDVH